MMKTLNRIIASILPLFTLVAFAFATNPEAFYVEVNPSSFSVGEAVDMTVSAINKDGTTVKDFDGDIFILVEKLSMNDYTTPGDGIYTFTASDQGVKLFSKGLKINKAGTYKIVVTVLGDLSESIRGEATVIVGDGNNSSNNQHSINITYPTSGSTESRTSINVMGNSTTLPNSPVEIFLNKSMVASGYTDSQGSFNVYISGLRSGENEIQAKIVDVNDIILGESDVIIVKYTTPADGIFNSISISPSHSVKQGDKISIELNTSEGVSSAELLFDNGDTYPMDRISAGKFSKDITLQKYGVFRISVSLMVNGTKKTYENVDSLDVAEHIGVYNVTFSSTGVDGTSIIMTWEQVGNAPKYNILYGTQRDNLQKNVIVSSTGVLVDNLQPRSKYYFQIIPMDAESHASGTPSDIFEYNPDTVYAACVIQGITVKSEKIGDKFFLVWDKVDNAVSYQVFRSDWKDMSSKTMVGETTDTRFEYYFNPDAESDQYAYYQIQATCADGSNAIIDDVEKVKVGPFENIIIIFVITGFVYCIYRLYRTIDQ